MTYPVLGRVLVHSVAALIAVGAFAGSAVAQSYPNKPVKVIVTFPPGGTPDIYGRLLSQELATLWKQSVVVENKTGASGTIGTDSVAKAAPDGYTLLFSHVGPIAISPVLPQKPPYDPIKDFAPITQIASGPTVLVVRPDFPAKTLVEYLDYAKKNPGKVSYGSVGPGSTTHLAGATIAHMIGTEMIHIPYKGSAPINNDLLGGNISSAFVNVAGVMSLIQGGQLRPLAVSTTSRAALPSSLSKRPSSTQSSCLSS
jgi:tripartite-type tricarboxylate transporter receptor subunit TctC